MSWAEESPAGLASLLADGRITEILFNGHDEVWCEKNGQLERGSPVFSDEAAMRCWVRKILSERGRKFDYSSPFADCVLPDGSRIHVAGPPVSRKGICFSIRKFPERAWSLEALENNGSLSAQGCAYLAEAVSSKRNIFLSGGTGCGKTSLLGALIAKASPHERIVALEDVAEIRTSHPHFISLEARPANQEGEGEIALDRLLREALRMRPDRLVVGECRGKEALDLLLALNTGHGGSFATIHANTPRDALQRLETLALLGAENIGEKALRNLIQAGVHIVVQLERNPEGRRISSIAEVKGIDGDRFLLKDIIR